MRHRPLRYGFTLVELLPVMVIMTLVLAFAGGALLLSRGSSVLSTAIPQVKGILDQGRQIALTHNKYVQVRFYKPTDGEQPAGYQSIGLFLADSPYYGTSDGQNAYSAWESGGRFRQTGKIFRLEDGLILPAAAEVSSFFSDLAADTSFHRTGQSTLAGKNYDWVAFYYLPNGTTDFHTLSGSRYEAKDAFFTLAMREQFRVSAPDLPSNFATFIMPPATGRAVVIRP